jgi:hypothetical protein
MHTARPAGLESNLRSVRAAASSPQTLLPIKRYQARVFGCFGLLKDDRLAEESCL